MRRLLVAVALIGTVSEVSAGEFEMPVLRGASDDYATSQYVAAPPTYTRWSGVYVGGQVGQSIGGIDFGSSVHSLVEFAVRNSVLSNHVTDWTALGKADKTATSFGGFVGYNMQWDDVTIGLEANYAHTSMSKSSSDSLTRSFLDNTNAPSGHDYTYDATVTARASITLTDFGTFRARGGWAAGNFLPYAFGGLAVARANVDRAATVTANLTDSFTTTNLVTDPVTGGLITVTTPQSVTSSLVLPGTQTSTQTGTFAFGYTAGFGVDMLVTPNMFVRGEYEFVQFPNIKSIRVSLTTLRVGGGLKF